MKKLNILDLHRNITKRQQKRIECFDKILELCHKKIMFQSDNRKTRIFFEVPEFLMGYPLFDLNDCIKHIMDSLKSNGFLAIYYFPRYIYVSWDLEEIEQHKIEMKKQKFYENKPEKLNTLDFKYKPSGKLSLDI